MGSLRTLTIGKWLFIGALLLAVLNGLGRFVEVKDKEVLSHVKKYKRLNDSLRKNIGYLKRINQTLASFPDINKNIRACKSVDRAIAVYTSFASQFKKATVGKYKVHSSYLEFDVSYAVKLSSEPAAVLYLNSMFSFSDHMYVTIESIKVNKETLEAKFKCVIPFWPS